MSPRWDGRGEEPMIAFGTLVQHVLSLDSSIEWVALEEPGREPRWAWRDAKTGGLYTGAAGDAHIADPLLFWLAGGGEIWRMNSTPCASSCLLTTTWCKSSHGCSQALT